MEHIRIYVEKDKEVNQEAIKLLREAKEYLKLKLNSLRMVMIYDFFGVSEKELKEIENYFFSQASVKVSRNIALAHDEKSFRVEYHKGGYDQRQHTVETLIRNYLGFESSNVKTSKLIIANGIDEESFTKLKGYYINPIEASERPLDEAFYKEERENTSTIPVVEGFINMTAKELIRIKEEIGFAMDLEDLEHCQSYFIKKDRNPTIAELKMLDTYWSDHCRHTTFMTELTDINVNADGYKEVFESALKEYFASREFAHNNKKYISLMDLATINMREIQKKGLLDDKEDSDEINAASIEIEIKVDGKPEKWLLMFKNETHNHPTEIEPFGGAATCLGGGIRDPLSGRSFVYQAMRLTGSADPRKSIEETRKGKLPQRKITRTAMEGYSSYGYQIGGNSGFTQEIYHEGFMAKRMELGALVSAAPKDWVYRGKPEPGDLVIYLGGDTGRDGLGAAVGSSVEQKSDALATAGAEVQKGNPPLERKIIRLFRNPKATKLIKKCNDFGAGGVAVAVGELADGLYIDLNKVPVKYPGMDGSELALSESQERMAIVIAKDDLELFTSLAAKEDLITYVIAEVTDENRVHMVWNGNTIIDIDRDFIETSGVRKHSKVLLKAPEGESYFRKDRFIANSAIDKLTNLLQDINVASQKGLVERFDSTIGAGSVLNQLGGSNLLTPQDGMVAKLPVLNGETEACSIMTFGYDPDLSSWSTFHGGYFAVVESLAKVVSLGGNHKKVRLSFQEFFERLGDDPIKWGKPFMSLLGAFKVQKALDIPSIGGKDSMSGSFEDINVPPSLFSFAVTHDTVDNIISKEFKKAGNAVIHLKLQRDKKDLLDLNYLDKLYTKVKELVNDKKIYSCAAVKAGGVARAVVDMSVGNEIGIAAKFNEASYLPLIGDLVVEIDKESIKEFKEFDYEDIGNTIQAMIEIDNEEITLNELREAFVKPLNSVFPVLEKKAEQVEFSYKKIASINYKETIAKPKAILPIFTGTHGEYDLGGAFEKAGAEVVPFVFKSNSHNEVKASIKELSRLIDDSQILLLAHGFLLGNEPQEAGSILNFIFRQDYAEEALMKLIKRKGLVLGIGQGFNSLVKLGLIEHGVINNDKSSLELAINESGEFVSTFTDIKVTSKLSPWFSQMELGESYSAPIALNEGRVILKENQQQLIDNGQISTVYTSINPTGSQLAIDSMTSPCGLVLGMNASIDRLRQGIYKNVDIKGTQRIIESGVKYFR